MCDKRSSVEYRGPPSFRVDACLRDRVAELRARGVETCASCCGHGRYQETIIVRESDGVVREFNTGAVVPRKTRFYVMDTSGFYYVPEVERIKTDTDKGVISRTVSEVTSLIKMFQPPVTFFEFFNMAPRCYLNRTIRNYPQFGFPKLRFEDDSRYSLMTCLRCPDHCLLPVSNIPLRDWVPKSLKNIRKGQKVTHISTQNLDRGVKE